MPRDGSGNFTLASNTQAVSGDPISSTKFNTLVQDLEADANTDRPIVAGGTGASTAAAARTNLGLEIGVNVQAYDAGLLSIAGLTTLADRSIYTTASDTYAVYTLTAAGRAILDDATASDQLTTLGFSTFGKTLIDDADAAATRTTLGLGTAALKNTGTSGDAVPLLNAANTFSALQSFSSDLSLDVFTSRGGNPETTGSTMTTTGARFLRAGTVGFDAGIYASGAIWLQMRNATDFTSNFPIVLNPNGGAVQIGANHTVWHAGNDGAGSGLDADTLDGVQGSAFATLTGSETLTNKTLTSPTINGGTSSTRVIASTETTGTLTVASANETIQATGDITIPNAVFAAGDIILIYAGASARTITQGASVTMRLGGTATTGSRTLAARGVAVLFFVSSSEVVVSGGAVT